MRTEIVRYGKDTHFEEMCVLFDNSVDKRFSRGPECTHTIYIQSKEEIQILDAFPKISKDYNINLSDVEIVYGECYTEYGVYNRERFLKGYSAEVGIRVKGYKTLEQQGVPLNEVFTEYRPGVIQHVTTCILKVDELDPPIIEGENLRVVLQSSNIDVIYTLEEIKALLNIDCKVLNYIPSTGTPDERKYILQLRREVE